MDEHQLRTRLLEALSVIRDSSEASSYERAFALMRVLITQSGSPRDIELEVAFSTASRAVFGRALEAAGEDQSAGTQENHPGSIGSSGPASRRIRRLS